jgi:cold-inducible RNA-binding protein
VPQSVLQTVCRKVNVSTAIVAGACISAIVASGEEASVDNGPGDGTRRHNAEREETMSNKLFVGSLSWNTDDRGLEAAFARFGEITDAKVVTDRETGRSRGFGFVTFADAAAAQKAAQEMNGADLDGRTLNVDIAQERGGGGGGRGGGGGGGRRDGGGGGGRRDGGGGGGRGRY